MSIKIEHLSFSYEDKEILKDISIQLPNSSLVILLGRSGSGKSTFLSILSGELDGYFGSITGIKRDDIARVFQTPLLLEYLNVEENIALSLSLNGYNKKEIKDRVDSLLKEVNLQDYNNRKISTLSGGEKMRVSLARALTLNRKVLILDEPTSALDEKSKDNIYKLLKEISKKRLVIVATHDEDIASKYSDTQLTLEDKTLYISKQTNITTYTPIYTNRIGKISFSDALKVNVKFLKTKKYRVILSTIFLSLNMALLYLSLILSNSFDTSFTKILEKNYATNSVYLYKEEEVYQSQHLSLKKRSIPDDDTIKKLNVEGFYIPLSYFIDEAKEITFNNTSITCNFTPTFDQDDKKLKEGSVIKNYEDVVVNNCFLKESKADKILGKRIRYSKAIHLNIEDTDYLFDIKYVFKIVGISSESDFLNFPTVFYSYPLIYQSFSHFIDKGLSLKEIVENEKDKESELLSHKLLIDVDDPFSFKEEASSLDLVAESLPISLSKSTKELTSSISNIISVFTILNLIASIMIQLLSIYSLYKDNIKLFVLSLIFSSTKKNKKRIRNCTSTIFFSISFVFILIMIALIKFVANAISYRLIEIKIFQEIDLILFIMLMIAMFFICKITSAISLFKIKDNDLKCELERDE